MAAALPETLLKRTQSFYDWELRGRGWMTWPYPVTLEPPFRPFFGHRRVPRERLDDAKRPTVLSSLFERFRTSPPPPPDPEPEEEPAADRDPRSEDEEPAEYLISLPPGTDVSRGALLGWLHALSTVSGLVSFELLGGSRRVELRLAVRDRDASHVATQLQAALPQAVLLAAPETLWERWSALGGVPFAAVEFGLAAEFMVPIALSRGAGEPLLPFIAALADLEAGELGLVQVLFEETRAPWGESILRSVVTPRGEPFFLNAPEITALAREKVSSPLFAVSLRIAGCGPSKARADEIVRRVASGLSQFGSPGGNEFIPLPTGDGRILGEDIIRRRTHRSGMLLSADELVSLVQLPGKGVEVPELYREREKAKEAPREVLGDGVVLGVNVCRGVEREVRLSPETRSKHVHVVGASGTGKSTLLVRMILEDIAAGHGVGVLDPHGDLVDEVAVRIPEERLADVVLFDPADQEHVIGWNILGAGSEVEKDLLSSDLVGVFRRLSTSWGDQMTSVLANAILVFLESEHGGTLLDLRRFLVEDGFRKEVLASVRDPYVASYWETEFPLLIGRKPQAPILTRLDTFLRSRLIRRIVTVRKPKLDFRHLTDDGLIFLGKLAQGAIGEENAALLGSLLVSKFHQVTLTRQATEPEERRPFFLYIDEFHHVATPSMASLFSGARKYRLGLTVAHQDLYQLHGSVPEVERSLLANAYTRVCFRLGEEDARTLAKGFSFFDERDLTGLGLGEAIGRVGGSEADFNLQTAPLPERDPAKARERREEIRRHSAAAWAVEPEEELAREPGREPEPGSVGSAGAPAPRQDSEPPVVREEKAAPEEKAPRRELDKATLDYLEIVATEPFLSVRERNDSLGLSAWKGGQVKTEILEAGLVREVPVNPGGRGERFLLLELTSEGRELLARYGVSVSAGHGRGGVAHQWWVGRLAEWLEGRGVSATIEDDSRGARVDLTFEAKGKRMAVEVEMGEGHALENIRKDLEAGYSFVVTLLDDSGALERVAKRLRAEFGVAPPNVLLGDLRDHETLLPPFLGDSVSLRPPNQDQERSAPRRKPGRKKRPAAPEPAPPILLEEPGAYTTPAAAEYLGLSPATLETMRVRGGGPVFAKLGRRVVYRREDLDVWLQESRRRSTSDPGPGAS